MPETGTASLYDIMLVKAGTSPGQSQGEGKQTLCPDGRGPEDEQLWPYLETTTLCIDFFGTTNILIPSC